MSVDRLPTGVSIARAKQDAKRLVKASELTLSESQNEIAFKHGRAKWPVLMHQLKTQSSLSVNLKQLDSSVVTLEFHKSKSLNVVVGRTRSGKTMLLLEFAEQWLKKGMPVLFLGAEKPDIATMDKNNYIPLITKSLMNQYPESFRAISNKELIDARTLDGIYLNGAILIWDEMPHMLHSVKNPNVLEQAKQLFNSSMHTFVAVQSMDEIGELVDSLKCITDDNRTYFLLKGSSKAVNKKVAFCHEKEALINEVNKLQKSNEGHLECIFVSSSKVQQLTVNINERYAVLSNLNPIIKLRLDESSTANSDSNSYNGEINQEASHSIIDLDNTLYSPEVDAPLSTLIMEVEPKWPAGATCATQESDGEILFWSADVDEVIEARERADLNEGLIPLLGLGQQVHANYFELNEQAYVASDWKTAVVVKN